MTGKCENATLWNNKMSEWTKLFEGVEFSPEIQERIKSSVNNINQDSLLDRLSAYTTPVTEDALKFFVK